MSWLSRTLGTDYKAPGGKYGKAYDTALQDYQDPTAGQGQLASLIQSQVAQAMPQFSGALQGVRENAIRRGMSTGDLGTSYEGDLASAFQNHIAQSVGQQAFNLFQGNRNTYLDLLSGAMDREDNAQNSASNRKSGLFGSIIGGLGSAAGAFF